MSALAAQRASAAIVKKSTLEKEVSSSVVAVAKPKADSTATGASTTVVQVLQEENVIVQQEQPKESREVVPPPPESEDDAATAAGSSQFGTSGPSFTRTSDNLVYADGSYVAGLQIGESLALKGQMTITVQKGAVRLFGATLRVGPRKHTVIVGATMSLPLLECTNVRGKYQDMYFETPENLHMREKYTTVVLIESLRTGLEHIPDLFPDDFKTVWSYEGAKLEPRTFSIILKASASLKVVRPFPSWTEISKSVCESYKYGKAPVVLVGGVRSSGKSTFVKYLSNFWLSESKTGPLYYIECDTKHPEYAPLGVVSLHRLDFDFSSAFGHSSTDTCIKAHSIGSTNPKDNYTYFLAALTDLFKEYKAVAKYSTTRTSLIVNTPGATKGLGLQLLEDIALVTNPTHWVYMGANSDIETFQDFQQRLSRHLSSIDDVLQPESILYSIDGGAHLLPGRGGDWVSSAHVQDLQLLTYFHYQFKTNSYDFSRHITHMKPYAVPYATSETESPIPPTYIHGFGIVHGDGVKAQDIGICLDGSVVSIIAVNADVELNVSFAEIDETKTQPSCVMPVLTPKNLATAIAPQNSRLLGLALVQSLDPAASKLRLLTPLDVPRALQLLQETGQKLILVRGSIEYPAVDMAWNGTTRYAQRDPEKRKLLGETVPYFGETVPVGVEAHILQLKKALEP